MIEMLLYMQSSVLLRIHCSIYTKINAFKKSLVGIIVLGQQSLKEIVYIKATRKSKLLYRQRERKRVNWVCMK